MPSRSSILVGGLPVDGGSQYRHRGGQKLKWGHAAYGLVRAANVLCKVSQ